MDDDYFQIINGQLFLQTTEKQLRPVHIVYKVPPKKKREESEVVPLVEEPEIEISDEEVIQSCTRTHLLNVHVYVFGYWKY